MTARATDQRGAIAGGDNVGGNKIVTTTVHIGQRRTQIEGWLQKLAEEVRENKQAKEMVESLQYFHRRQPSDGIAGLEAKLDAAGRSHQNSSALHKKEFFAKQLEKYSLYGSAQEIFAYFMSKIENCFETEILPYLGDLSPEEIDALVKEKLVEPVLDEMGCGDFLLNYNHVMGMVYWLAEQCFIRWHA